MAIPVDLFVAARTAPDRINFFCAYGHSVRFTYSFKQDEEKAKEEAKKQKEQRKVDKETGGKVVKFPR